MRVPTRTDVLCVGKYLVSLVFPTTLLDSRSELGEEETTTDMPTIVNIKSGVNIESGYSCSKSYHYHVDPTIMPADLRSSGVVHDDE